MKLHQITLATLLSSVLITSACSSQTPKQQTHHSEMPAEVKHVSDNEKEVAEAAVETATSDHSTQDDAQNQAQAQDIAQHALISEENVSAETPPAIERPEITRFLFEFNKATLDENALNNLSQHATYLTTHPESKIAINGHADPQGDVRYNEFLAMERAKYVAGTLQELGVSKIQIELFSWGANNPDPEATHHRDNRRVELMYSDTEETYVQYEDNQIEM